MAGVYQIPLPVVQSILGHMSPEMTRHYQAHADRQAKERYLQQLPDFLHVQEQLPSGKDVKQELFHLLETFPPAKLEQVLTFCRKLG